MIALSVTSLMVWYEYQYDYQTSKLVLSNVYNFLGSCSDSTYCNIAPLYTKTNSNNTSITDTSICNGECNIIASSNLQKSRGFAIVSEYSEQQVGAAMNLLTLCKWSKYVKIYPVEPFVRESMYRLPKSLSKTVTLKALRFRDYFNISFWNTLSPQYGAAKLVSWKTFMRNKPQSFIYVVLLTNLQSKTTSNSLLVNNETENESLCRRGYLQFLARYKNDTDHILQVKLVRQVCMSIVVPMSIKEFSEQIYGGFKPDEVIVWFSVWRGIAKSSGKIMLLEEPYHRTPETIKLLQTSGKIMQDSKLYVEETMKSTFGHYIAISVRTVMRARFMDPSNHYAFFHNCYKKLKQGISMATVNISSTKIFVAADLGRFGDTYANKHMSNEMIKVVLNELFDVVYNGSLTIDKWEQSFIDVTNGITDSGYIAALQGHILQNSGCLIVFGGKSYFQGNVLFKYKQSSLGNGCVIEVCYVPYKGTTHLTS